MVRCMVNGKVYETCLPEETEFDDETSQATKIVEDEFDETGRARVKVVYVDIGDLNVHIDDLNGDWSLNKSFRKDASMHIQIIISREEEKERMEGTPRPRLIFIKQDRDYWPGSDIEPGVMTRRAAKENLYNATKENPYNELKYYVRRPDSVEMYVPPLTRHFVPSLDIKESKIIDFRRYFDPSLPGIKYILHYMDDVLRAGLNECLLLPDLLREWNEWMSATKVDKALDELRTRFALLNCQQ